MNKKVALVACVFSTLGVSQVALAAEGCNALPNRAAFELAVKNAVAATNGFGFGLPMWVTLVDNTGKVCQVYSHDGVNANTGQNAGNNAWLGSRVISAQKANTANAFSLDHVSLPTGSVYATVVPGGSLYGLQHSNPVDASTAYGGSPNTYGTNADFLKNRRIGGVNVFGGGVALYDASGKKIGAVGASGDTSCRDHSVAWRTRAELGLDNYIPATGLPADDRLKLVATPTALYEHPACGVADPTGADNGYQ